ncbi:MAG: Fis family transcriptional regulator [Novosphingobium sp. 28-62-57]|nr:MAG: Fis family transcriptional regulator [Novosphingobium sp. 12-63-9]OYZ08624.1 MAG: Fis family transcriptional regulator [Novosphingobium sp. 28-62-57]
MLQQSFELENMEVEVAADPLPALAQLSANFEGIFITDVRMPGIDGMEALRRVHAIDPEIPVIMMTGHGDIPMVIDALKRGVFDFIPKPFPADHLIATARRAIDHRALVLENRALRAGAARAEQGELMIGESPVMVRLRETIRQVALADIDVLIEGETGTGKELAAVLLHRWGPRRSRPFVAINCGTLPANVAEAELFGYAAGAHAQYRNGHAGRIEQASGGTLFLDAIETMPLPLQGALLRVIEEREVMKIGGDRPRPIDLRVIASTSSNLSDAVAQGTFRKDLFYQLQSVQLSIPPLRERKSDIPLLFGYFLDEAAKRLGNPVPFIGRDIHVHIATHEWLGNVRELRSFAQRVALGLQVEQDEVLVPGDLNKLVADFEADIIRKTLTKAGGDISVTLGLLGVARNTLYDKLKRYGIRAADFRAG